MSHFSEQPLFVRHISEYTINAKIAKHAGKRKDKKNIFCGLCAFAFCFSLLFIFLSLSILFLSSNVSAASLTADAAAVNLTPPLEMNFALGGYGARMSQPALGVHDSIRAKAIVFSDGEKKYALVTLDVLGLPPNVKPQLLHTLGDESWTADNVMLLPSHSHASLDMTALNDQNILNSPQIGIFQPELLDFVIDKLAQVIKKASTNLQPVFVGAASATVDGMNRNRRRDAAVDRELALLRVDRLDGSPLAVLVNWTAHPTFLDEKDMLVSAGWPGALQQSLEKQIGAGIIAMYFNGAQGDQAPISQGGDDHYQRAEIYGRRLAELVMPLYQSVKVDPPAHLDFAHSVVDLPERVAHPLFKKTGGEEYGIDDATMKIILGILCSETAEVGAVRLGDFLIVGAPGELACQLGLNVKSALRQKGVAFPTIGGLANEWISYIMSAEQYKNAGYETSVSFYGPQLGHVIEKTMLRVSEQLAQ